MILEELYVQVPKSVKMLLIIVERRDDFTGRQVHHEIDLIISLTFFCLIGNA